MKFYTRTWWLARFFCVFFLKTFVSGKSRKQQQDMMSVMNKVGNGVMQRRIEWEHSNHRFQSADNSKSTNLVWFRCTFIIIILLTNWLWPRAKKKNKLIGPSFLLTWAYTKIQNSLFLKHHSKYSGTKNLFSMIT